MGGIPKSRNATNSAKYVTQMRLGVVFFLSQRAIFGISREPFMTFKSFWVFKIIVVTPKAPRIKKA